MTLDSFIMRCAKAGFTIPDNEDWRDLRDCLTCGDIRYEGQNDAFILDVFMKNEGVIREESAFTIPLPFISDQKGYYGNGDVQVLEKAILTEILEERGFAIEGYELGCISGKADLIANNKDGLTVIGEVGACRVSKVYQTLQTPPFVERLEDMQLWHLPYPNVVGDGSSKNVDCRLFIYKRGNRWDKLQSEYEAANFEMLSNAFKLMGSG